MSSQKGYSQPGFPQNGQHYNGNPHHPEPPVFQRQTPYAKPANGKKPITVPPILIDDAAGLILDMLEMRKHPDQRMRIDQLKPGDQALFRDIAQVVLEMGVTVILSDAIQYLDNSNGDMGAAFGRALRRYIHERL